MNQLNLMVGSEDRDRKAMENVATNITHRTDEDNPVEIKSRSPKNDKSTELRLGRQKSSIVSPRKGDEAKPSQKNVINMYQNINHGSADPSYKAKFVNMTR